MTGKLDEVAFWYHILALGLISFNESFPFCPSLHVSTRYRCRILVPAYEVYGDLNRR